MTAPTHPVRAPYEYNPACVCDWCRNGGQQPPFCGDTGHSWCYAEPHVPPPAPRATATTTAATATP